MDCSIGTHEARVRNRQMSNPFIRKLASRAHLDVGDVSALRQALCSVSQVEAGQDLILEGECPDAAYVILDGFACRYKLVPDGGRSIVAYLVPGDGCDLHASILNRAIHSVATLTPCSIAALPYQKIKELAATRPNIYRALWRSILVDEAVLQEWLVGIGRRSADKQVAHIICELLARLRAVGLGFEPNYHLPLTQPELADTAGLSNVHIYRVLADLRKDGLIESGRRYISVPDVKRLENFARFDASYLLLSGSDENPAPVGKLPDMTGQVRR
ncbi:Crp/Fnr family transcriptional regulator [Methylobacterium tardum]|uniref:Crp/Fnr family transcriptional regulator n=1 Tax=Methylobacterium tardum TaxID=374432 RepID=UPI0020200002|nr:Crp/Fnr family transcriptional regulator [Methylobacterium tardum]URD34658.1 Crp/Fnr family transcriptional regulator [Methylobacterium tardum]